MTTIDLRLLPKAITHPRPLLFATVSGAHLYGFPSPDSDWDLRGAHILALPEVITLDAPLETIEISNKTTAAEEGIEFDIVSHDIKKFFSLMLKKNGYVLEQLFSPLIVLTSPEHAELKHIAAGCITRHHAHHYLGFVQTNWKLFEKEHPRRVKPLLYTFRGLLAGIHLLKTGRVEANIVTLNDDMKLPYIPDLVARKTAGPEQSTLPDTDVPFYEAEVKRLEAVLRDEQEKSTLPDLPTSRPALNDLLLRLRLRTD